jgi:diguanylate cyclase (GGDEF)-like protein
MMQQVVGALGEVWRIGGEEFLITLPAVSLETAQELAKRLRVQTAQQTIDVQGQVVPSVTMTIGLALYPEHGESAETLIRALEEALERGKVEGRNCVRVVGA